MNGRSIDCGALKGGRPSADYSPPTTPAGLSASAATQPLRVELAWTASTDPSGVVGYRVYRGGAFYAFAPGRTFVDTKVASLTTYAYTVYAQDAAGNLSAASQRVSVTTRDGTPPTPPAMLTVTGVTATSATVSWSAATDNVGVTGYLLFADDAHVGTYSPSARTATVTGLTCGSRHTLVVVPVDAEWNYSWVAVEATTAPCG